MQPGPETGPEPESELWDTRFADTDDAASRLSRSFELKRQMQDVLIAVRNELPFISTDCLKFDSCLGRGSSFEVNREVFNQIGEAPYFVAVKRIVMGPGLGSFGESQAELQESSRRLVSVMNEVRVLTNPKLRFHSCLVSALGWGWTTNPWSRPQPYLVMSYSDAGTLAVYAKKRRVTLKERRLMALDVAMGLRALHECNIVHGDVKVDNVLVYGISFREEDPEYPFMAKLSDFGAALFEKDFAHQDQYYLGTRRYNAPEICGLVQHEEDADSEPLSKFEQFKAADCYSFGFLLWETFKLGSSFVDSSWLKSNEDVVDFLERAFHSKSNAMLDLALIFFRQVQANSGIEGPPSTEYPSNPTRSEMNGYLGLSAGSAEVNTPTDSKFFKILKDTVSLCLQDSLQRRGSVGEIVKALSGGIEDDTPREGSSTAKTVPHDVMSNYQGLSTTRYESLRDPHAGFSATISGLRLDKLSILGDNQLRAVRHDAPPDPSSQLVRIPAYKRGVTITVTPQFYRYGDEDMFKALVRRQPPWYNQCEAASHIQRAVNEERDQERMAQAQLQLAIMYQVGYGVAPDSSKVMSLLEAASANNKVAQAIFTNVYAAFNPDDEAHTQAATGLGSHLICKNPAVLSDGVLWRGGSEDNSGPEDQSLTLGSINVASIEVLTILVRRGRYEPHLLSEALTAACRDGHLDAAMILAKHLTDLSAINKTMPNPLHWLIMFSPAEATKLLQVLVSGPNRSEETGRLKAVLSLLASEHELTTMFLPHRCLNLYGTPMHWAVMAGYTDLVAAFIRLGADVNVRNRWRRNPHEELYPGHHHSVSPLDLAVACHFPRIVKMLLDNGGEVYGGDWHWKHSPFHMIAYDTLPFARYMAHGQAHRTALRQTIQILLDQGLDINALDSMDQTPLFVAVKALDLEPYVIEELLLAGALPGTECDKQEGSIVASAVICCGYRRFSSWKIPLLLPHAREINACAQDATGYSALHLCAVFDAVPAADILLQTPGIDVDVETGLGRTPVSFAAQLGSLGVLASLIRKGADIHRGEALQGAISAGQIDAVVMLVNAGAGPRLLVKERLTSILHYAVRRHYKRPSFVRACLGKCPQLREQEILNYLDHDWTPLHEAAYYGDVDAVSALLEAGADLHHHRSNPGSGTTQTALDLATKTLEKLTFVRCGVRHYASHPFTDAEIGDLPQSNDVLNQEKRIEMRFMDSLSEIINILRRAELETRDA